MYVTIRAAKYLGCTPWELEAKPSYYRDWALISEKADQLIEEAVAKEAAKKNKRR